MSCASQAPWEIASLTHVYHRDSVHVINDHIQYKNRLIKTGRYIAGIDYDRFATTLRDEKVKARISELESLYEGKKVIIGVDRLDYTKGLTEKMEGFRVFLDQHPELRDKVILIQIAIPSREDVKEYQDLEGEVSKLVGQIIGKHGESAQDLDMAGQAKRRNNNKTE